MTQERPKILICECHSTEHQIVIHYDTEDNLCYLHIHLRKRSFFRRLKYGIMYIFGYHCKYGHWDEFIFDPKDAYYLQQLVNKLKENE